MGFVPTMGALHEGHMSLIDRAREHCDCIVASIFVNPTQFNDPEDLVRYPRTLDSDLDLLKKHGADVVFVPGDASEVYPAEYSMFHIELGMLDQHMEGEFRPGHFQGVMNVVSLLFQLVQPDEAFFGLKDYQQYRIIQAMAKLRHPNIAVTGIETSREANGLARSSRNRLLSDKQRKDAALLYQCLCQARDQYNDLLPSEIVGNVEQRFAAHPALKLEYFRLAHAETLAPIEDDQRNEPARGFIAAWCDQVRLIDNLAVNP